MALSVGIVQLCFTMCTDNSHNSANSTVPTAINIVKDEKTIISNCKLHERGNSDSLIPNWQKNNLENCNYIYN